MWHNCPQLHIPLQPKGRKGWHACPNGGMHQLKMVGPYSEQLFGHTKKMGVRPIIQWVSNRFAFHMAYPVPHLPAPVAPKHSEWFMSAESGVTTKHAQVWAQPLLPHPQIRKEILVLIATMGRSLENILLNEKKKSQLQTFTSYMIPFVWTV